MLHIHELTYRLGARLLFDEAGVAIPDGAKVGFVGRNGTGKTTLFRIIEGELAAEAGTTSLPRNMRIGAVAQEVPSGPERLIDVVLAGDRERAALLAERETATDPMRMAEIEMRLVDIEAHSAEARAGSILHGLGFDSVAQQRPCSDFSGGWRMRVALAAVLFSQPDLLLLDEPTNYLDLEGTLWLYDYLGKYPRTAIVISHDRELLDEAVDHILHLDQGKLTLYRGNYTGFDRQRREKQTLLVKAKEKQDAERKHLQAFVDRFKAKASKASQAQSRVKRLEKMATITAIVDRDVQPFILPAPKRLLAPPLIVFDGVAAGYGERTVLDHIDLSLAPDDRIALLGSNGNGKSTFAKVLSGRLEPLKGKVVRSGKLEVAFFTQHQLDELDAGGTPYSHVDELMRGEPEAKKRSRVAQLGFSGQRGDTPVAKLSGGEKARLQLGLAAFNGPHLLVLDEPTNHLDIDSRAALAQAINDFPGAVILISHDRFLIEATCDRLWLVANGRVEPYEGDLDDYRRFILSGGVTEGKSRPAKQAPAAVAAAPAPQKPKADKKALQPLRKRIEALEARIVKLNGLVEKVDGALADTTLFSRQPGKAAELSRQRADLAKLLVATEEEWLAAGAELDAVDAA